jgi:hypothetical protein
MPGDARIGPLGLEGPAALDDGVLEFTAMVSQYL